MAEESKAATGIGCSLMIAAALGLSYAVSLQKSQRPASPLQSQKAHDKQEAAEPVDKPETEAEKIADGSHCIDGWDLSFPPIKKAVKASLRNPRSFEHVSTNWSHMGKDGKFGLIMKYRAQNGFGGMNLEVIGALVDARTCEFHEVTAATLAKRALADPTTS